MTDVAVTTKSDKSHASSAKPYAITITDHEMEAWISFHSDMSVPFDQLRGELAEAGVVSGIDWFFLRDLAEAHLPGQPYCIAQGIPPEEGLEYFFSRDQVRTPKRLPDGRVDFYNLDTIQNVVEQQILVAKIPLDASKSGETVSGRTISPSHKDVPLPEIGANVAGSEDGQALIALINGHPVLFENRLSVEPTYTLEGDVDFSVGNMTCVGHVIITGDVKSGFSIKGAQDVTVHGVVDGGDIDAGGAIYLYGNVFGNKKSHLCSSKDIQGIYIDSTTVETQKNIVLTRGARRSCLKAGGSILVQGDSSSIIGGTAQAGDRIVSHDLGSEQEIATKIDILPGAFDASTAMRFLRHIGAMLETDSAWLTREWSRTGSTESLETLRRVMQQCQVALPQFMRYFTHRRRGDFMTPGCLGTVVVTGTIYPAVTVCIGGASLHVTQPMSQVVFSQVDGAIQVRSLDRMEMAFGERSK